MDLPRQLRLGIIVCHRRRRRVNKSRGQQKIAIIFLFGKAPSASAELCSVLLTQNYIILQR